MTTCRSCNFLSCPNQGTHMDACSHHQDLHFEEPEFEAYTFDERTGSERIHFFHTEAARDAFVARQPSHKMAH